MKNLKKLAVTMTVLGVIGAAGLTYASVTYKTPAEIASEVTGKSLTEVNEDRASGKTYGTIAKDADKLDEFQDAMLEQRKAILDERVKNGELTQEEADAIYNRMKENQAYCDGTGNTRGGMMNGVGFGRGRGNGQGFGRGAGCGN